MKSWLRRYWIKAFLLTISSGLAAAVFSASVLAGRDEYKNDYRVLWLGAFAALMVVLVTAAETALNEREKNKAREEASLTAAQLRLWYNDILTQISAPLGELAEEYSAAYSATGATPPSTLTDAQRDKYRDIRKTVLIGAASLTAPLTGGLPTARSALFLLSDPTLNKFELDDWAGRTGAPRAKVEASAGAHFWYDILKPGTAYHAGSATGLLSQVDQASTKYRSVIAVPVTAGTKKFGVLTVDAPNYNDLKTPHVRLLQGLADILGATLALK
ncbi:GAF domain-containing protein [Streptomyces sp. NPDC001815]|uniref:GAF domain-containing protein n=1 Tax=Streptomyces sp. NPDC001815 TaxID=3154526 RepID=UPI003320FB71